jgi:hypothetical protein
MDADKTFSAVCPGTASALLLTGALLWPGAGHPGNHPAMAGTQGRQK